MSAKRAHNAALNDRPEEKDREEDPANEGRTENPNEVTGSPDGQTPVLAPLSEPPTADQVTPPSEQAQAGAGAPIVTPAGFVGPAAAAGVNRPPGEKPPIGDASTSAAMRSPGPAGPATGPGPVAEGAPGQPSPLNKPKYDVQKVHQTAHRAVKQGPDGRWTHEIPKEIRVDRSHYHAGPGTTYATREKAYEGAVHLLRESPDMEYKRS